MIRFDDIAPAAIAVTAALTLPACSFFQLHDFPPAQCDADTDCQALNEAEGIDLNGCELYQCQDSSRRCVFRERDDDEDEHVALRCGGDDCDDSDPAAYPGATPNVTEIVQSLPMPRWVRWGQRDGRLGATYSLGTGSAGFDVLTSDTMVREVPTMASYAMDAMTPQQPALATIQLMCPTASSNPLPPPTDPPANVVVGVTCETHDECQDGLFCNGYERCDPDSAGGAGDEIGCRPPPSTTPCGTSGQFCDEATNACVTVQETTSCTQAELAVAHARNDEWFGAAINTSGCAVGQLRVGWMTNSAVSTETGVPGPNLLLRGPPSRAPGFTGVDLTVESTNRSCTGGTRTTDVAGASAVAVAALDPAPSVGRRRPQALVAYLAAPLCRRDGSCPAGTAGATGPVDVEVIGAWLEQAPTSGDRATTWVSVTNSGRAQRFETQTDGTAPIALSAVEAEHGGYVLVYGAASGGLAARFVPAFEDPAEVLETAPYPTVLSAGTTSRDTKPIGDLGTESTLPGGAGPTAMVDQVSVAVGPPTGDSAPLMIAWLEDGAVYVAMGQVSLASGAITAEAPTQLSDDEADPPAEPPAASYVETGLCGEGCDGFAVTWVESGTARLFRIRTDGTEVDAAPFDLERAAIGPRAYGEGASLRVGWYDPDAQALVVSSGQCPPPEQ